MKIEWIGHACFRLTAKDGTTVITDPYDPSVGAKMVPLEAAMITMSHEHHDHCETQMIVGAPLILRGAESGQAGSVSASAVMSYHDDAEGALRGPNAIRVFLADGLKIVHMGDQGCVPQEAALAQIAGADVMMIPVGGTYTVDAQGAKAIVAAAKPRCVIPMHVKTKGCGYPIAPVDHFLEAMGVPGRKAADGLEIAAGSVPEGVVLLAPQADAL